MFDVNADEYSGFRGGKVTGFSGRGRAQKLVIGGVDAHLWARIKLAYAVFLQVYLLYFRARSILKFNFFASIF